MEIPRIFRETPIRVEFVGKFDESNGVIYFKYPGGKVPALGVWDLAERLEGKGFGDEEIKEIVELFLNTVATEATISTSKVTERVF